VEPGSRAFWTPGPLARAEPGNSARVSAPDGRPLLALESVSFRYPSGLEILNQISMTARRGEVVAIVGPSGCGKSTLLSLIAGFRRPSAGTIAWDETEPDRGIRRNVTMLFQHDTLLPWKTAQRNIEFSLRLARVPRHEIKSRAADLLQTVGLAEFKDVLPAKLSGGMRRRLGLATAMAPWPSLILMDEPFAALDEPTRLTLHDQVLKLAARYSTGLVLVTHDLAEAITLGDRVYVLSRRPSNVVDTHVIPFQSPRNVFRLRETGAYQEIYARIWSRLMEEF
jgi:NitT/TauT family transport system ATP-binding protein